MSMRVHSKCERGSVLAALLGCAIAAAQFAPAQAAEWGTWYYMSMSGNARLFVRYQWNSGMNGHNVQFRCENNNMRKITCHYKAEAKCANGSWVNLTGGENLYVPAYSSTSNQSWRGKCANAGGVQSVTVRDFWVD